MAAAEINSEVTSDPEFTKAKAVTSDQTISCSAQNLNDGHTTTWSNSVGEVKMQIYPPASDSHEPHTKQDSQTYSRRKSPKTTAVSREDDTNSCKISTSMKQITIVKKNFESAVPKIDAVLLTGQKYNNEQRANKYGGQFELYDKTGKILHVTATCESNNNTFDHYNERQTSEVQKISKTVCSENPPQDFVHPHPSIPQILKIQTTKASKRHVPQDIVNPTGMQTKYLALKNSTSYAALNKTVQILKFPSSHGTAQPILSSGLIDHNLKPLQIQHNLENKTNKCKAKLQLKYQNDSTETIHYPVNSKHSPVKKSSGKGSHKLILKEVLTGTSAYANSYEEASAGSVYLDIDPSYKTSLELSSSQVNPMMNTNAEGKFHLMLENSGQNISMDHYLPDFTDLPQFPNIPLDMDDKCDEPLHLTPSIPFNVLNYNWQKYHSTWHNYNPTSIPAILTKTQVVTPMPHSDSVNNFKEKPNQEGGCDTSFHGDDNVIVSLNDELTNLSKNCEKSNYSQTKLNTSTMTVTQSSARSASMANVIKVEKQVPWSAGSGQTVAFQSVTVADQTASEDVIMTGQSVTTPGQPLHSVQQQISAPNQPTSSNQALILGNPISSALMTAFDVDSNSSALEGLQNSTYMGYNPDASHPYPDNSTMGISTFLSPPPSVEQIASQSSTPCPDNESGYLTMDEHDRKSPRNPYWQQNQLPQNHDGMVTNDPESNDKIHSQTCMYSDAVTYSYVDRDSYPYTHQDSHYQTLHQTTPCSVTSVSSSSTDDNSSEIICYPFSDLMQLHPGPLGNDQDMSIQYVRPTSFFQTYPHHVYCHYTAGHIHPHQSTPARKRGRGGRPRGGNKPSTSQSNPVPSSLKMPLEAFPKRQYRRRSSQPECKKKTASKMPRSSSADGFDNKKGRHNEPLNQKAISIMNEWYCQHEENPYPSKDEKERMAREGRITSMQVKSWFANKRNRSNNTRPKVQKRAMEEKLMQIYNQLSRKEGTSLEEGGNSLIIKELSQIIRNRIEPELSRTPESKT